MKILIPSAVCLLPYVQNRLGQQSYLKHDIIKISHYTKLIAENRLTKASFNTLTEFIVV